MWFSRLGALVAAVQALVTAAEAGYGASELERVLHVEAKRPAQVVQNARLGRQRGVRVEQVSEATADGIF